MAVLASGCGDSSGGASKGKATTVRVGTIKALSDAPIYIAIDRGYFKQQGLDVQNVTFDTGAKMVAPLSSGQLDAGAGSPSAGLYNAMARGLGMKIVADKGHVAKNADYVAILVRKAAAGQIHDFSDLRGRKIGVVSLSNSSGIQVSNALEAGGLTLKDADVTELDFPSLGTALANGSIDVAFAPEPFVTKFVDEGIAVRWRGVDQVVPDQQAAVLLYSTDFATKQRDAASRFMTAYLQGARDYHDAFFAHKGYDAIVRILTKYTTVTDPSLYKKLVPAAIDPDGEVNLKSINSDYDWYDAHGLLEGDVDLAKAVDMSFAHRAATKLDAGG